MQLWQPCLNSFKSNTSRRHHTTHRLIVCLKGSIRLWRLCWGSRAPKQETGMPGSPTFALPTVMSLMPPLASALFRMSCPWTTVNYQRAMDGKEQYTSIHCVVCVETPRKTHGDGRVGSGARKQGQISEQDLVWQESQEPFIWCWNPGAGTDARRLWPLDGRDPIRC